MHPLNCLMLIGCGILFYGTGALICWAFHEPLSAGNPVITIFAGMPLLIATALIFVGLRGLIYWSRYSRDVKRVKRSDWLVTGLHAHIELDESSSRNGEYAKYISCEITDDRQICFTYRSTGTFKDLSGMIDNHNRVKIYVNPRNPFQYYIPIKNEALR